MEKQKYLQLGMERKLMVHFKVAVENTPQSTVSIPRIAGAFPCTCGDFQSWHIPCSCVSAVYTNKLLVTENLFQLHNLYPRWRLENHTLYAKAKLQLGIIVSTPRNPSTGGCDTIIESGNVNSHDIIIIILFLQHPKYKII